MSIDIGQFDTIQASDKGAEIQLTHPISNVPIGLFVTVLGKHSDVFREHIRNSQNERLRAQANATRRGKEVPTPTAEEAETRAVELMVLCTTGWRSDDKPTWTYKGEELEFTIQNAIRVYTEMLWIREQVDTAIGDLENFIKA